MKKVMRFIKHRICPIMFALVIVFFSVVIPCAKVEAASIAAPVAGYTYFDLVYSLLYSTGFAASMQESDASKSFDKAMYDGFCDYFSMWCYDNLGTADGEEIGEMLRALPDQIVDGTVTVSKALWEAVQSWASDAYDNITMSALVNEAISSTQNPSFDVSSFPYHFNACLYNYDQQKITLSRDIWCNSPCKAICLNYDSYASCYLLYSSQFRCKNVFGTYTANRYSDNLFYECFLGVDLFNCIICGIPVISCSSPDDYFNSISSVDEIPELAPDVLWPQQDLAIDRVSNPTWDDAIASDVVVPGEVADTGSIAIDDSIPADSDVIPGTVDVPGEIDVPKEEEEEKKEEEEEEEEEDNTDETVTDEEIGTLPDTAAAAGDITKLFPFCIPFDLVALIKGMKAEQKAPVWTFKYYFKDINYTFEFTVDMTDYEKYIKIFRAGIVIFWIITLMFVTIRYTSAIKD